MDGIMFYASMIGLYLNSNDGIHLIKIAISYVQMYALIAGVIVASPCV